MDIENKLISKIDEISNDVISGKISFDVANAKLHKIQMIAINRLDNCDNINRFAAEALPLMLKITSNRVCVDRTYVIGSTIVDARLVDDYVNHILGRLNHTLIGDVQELECKRREMHTEILKSVGIDRGDDFQVEFEKWVDDTVLELM